ncbi:MAG: 2TM domain-containing protein [Leptodesmis sp.]|uniref:2TM domain-containing protein n=1 Tax=Leptodesmis sp. TaxID=3100501 RepID=UPI003D0CC042
MPPRWPRQPDRNDPAYRKLDDRMTFATHVALFAAVNSGLWFFRLAPQKIGGLATPGGLPGTPWITVAWALFLLAHAVYVFAIAQYSASTTSAATAGSGFGSNDQPTAKSKKS